MWLGYDLRMPTRSLIRKTLFLKTSGGQTMGRDDQPKCMKIETSGLLGVGAVVPADKVVRSGTRLHLNI